MTSFAATRASNKQVREPADPGTKTSRIIALIAAILMAGAVITLQNIVLPMLQPSADEAAAAAAGKADPAETPPPMDAQLRVTAELFVRMRELVMQDPSAVPQLEQFVTTFGDRVVLSIAEAELDGVEPALDRLAALDEELRPYEAAERADGPKPEAAKELRTDVRLVRTIYEDSPDALSEADADRLRARYGYFGKVALTHGMDDDAPERAALFTNAVVMTFTFFAIGVILLGVVVTGFGLLIVAVVHFSSRRNRRAVFTPPEPGGSVFLESYALFVASFLVLITVGHLAIKALGLPETSSLGVQWLLLLTPLWPMLRGMSPKRWARAIGLHGGRHGGIGGVFAEIGWGIVCYITTVPVFLLGTIFALVLVTAWGIISQRLFGGGPPEPVRNEILEIVASADLGTVFLLLALGTMWAPLCEELIFRGALYRHMRGRVGVALASTGTALLFAFMHGYGPLMTPPLIALGVMFALVREWRGSIVAPMVMHFIHNATLMVTMVVLLRFVMG